MPALPHGSEQLRAHDDSPRPARSVSSPIPARTAREILKERNERDSQTRQMAGRAEKQHRSDHVSDTRTSAPSQGPAMPRLSSSASGQGVGDSSHSHAEPTLRRRPDFATTGTRGVQRRSNMPSFPHAFERWELLSSHWEGLTSYWLHRLENDRDAITQAIPSASAMTRQINDLSAAGANLFHGLVELQRLRASSERKFQRWHQETRLAMAKDADTIADLQDALQADQAALRNMTNERVRAVQDREIAEQQHRQAELIIRDLRKELAINKDEARRAWEELGRREQEESKRADELRSGKPTVVAGVQVVPTAVSAVSGSHIHLNRPPDQVSYHDPAHETEGQRPVSAMTDPFHDEDHEIAYADDVQSSRQRGDQSHRSASATSGSVQTAIPSAAFGAHTHPSASRQSPVSSYGQVAERFYQQPPQSALSQERSAHSPNSAQRRSPPANEAAMRATLDLLSADDDELYELNPVGDDSGRLMPLRASRSPQQHRPTTSAGPSDTSDPPVRVDMAGLPVPSPPSALHAPTQGGGWETLQTRHHHPTRLSDVLEEQEDGGARGNKG